ncbi:hypothetical protein [Nocardia amamiensis]|uniref:hypothetical protein n=1 Tax=Nocardia amamiensis TaxID=404578 RepID=UPI000B241001|nr:hypothetical protein [Nocardia amamiensis]
MTDERRTPLSERVPVGEQVGICEFVMDNEGHLCGRPVFAKSLHGRRPKYCNEVVDGVLHNGKNAAKARELHGFNAAAMIRPAEATVSSAPSPASQERGFVTTPATAAPSVSSVSSLEEKREGRTAVVDVAEAREAEEPKHPVTASVTRLAALVEQFTQAASVIARAAESIAPEIHAAVEAAGTAGAAEREVIQVLESADEALVDANSKVRVAEEKMRAAEERAAKHADERVRMAAERDEARAEAAQAVAAAKAERDAALAEAENQRERAEAAERNAEAAAESVEQRVNEIERRAEERINAAVKAQTRAEGEAESLRDQVTDLREQVAELTNRLNREAEKHRTALHKIDEEHRAEVREVQNYWQGVVRQAYEITGRQDEPEEGKPARRGRRRSTSKDPAATASPHGDVK